MSHQHHGRKVFGIGLSRTGTTSLAKALRILGYRTIHAPISILKNQDGKLALNAKAAMQYEAMTDSTVAVVYRELDAAFPGAKFILTLRDVEKWLISMRRVRKIYPLLRLHPALSQLCYEAFGESHLNNEEIMRTRFLQHTREVLAYFRGRDDLLVMDFSAGDGWEKLCNFLGQPIPSIPFPHSNRQSLLTWSNLVDTFRGIA
ncbi:MAG: hypothetical protein KGI73_01020 [Patescibacteria group bacterium]|nr:hypothetical protein [Patescibacteria group bacterium]